MKPAPRRWHSCTARAAARLSPRARARARLARPRRALRRGCCWRQQSAFHDPLALPGMRDAVATMRERDARPATASPCTATTTPTASPRAPCSLARCAAPARTCVAYIPNRMTEGYGLHAAALARARARRGVRCVITVDCGTSSVDGGARPAVGHARRRHRSSPSPGAARDGAAARARGRAGQPEAAGVGVPLRRAGRRGRRVQAGAGARGGGARPRRQRGGGAGPRRAGDDQRHDAAGGREPRHRAARAARAWPSSPALRCPGRGRVAGQPAAGVGRRVRARAAHQRRRSHGGRAPGAPDSASATTRLPATSWPAVSSSRTGSARRR